MWNIIQIQHDLDLWPFDPKIHGSYPRLMGSLCMKFHDDRCKRKAIMRHKPFSVISALWPSPLTPKSIGHILNSWGVFNWSFMMIGVKKVITQHKPFSAISHYDIDLWQQFKLSKITRAYPGLTGNLCVKFDECRCKGKAIMHHNLFSVITTLWPWPLTFWPQNP